MAYLAVPQQLENSPLIWGESNNFTDDRFNEFVLFGGFSLAVRGFWCLGDSGHSVTLVQPNAAVCKIGQKEIGLSLRLGALLINHRTDCCG